eukprot:GHVT01087246.1.p1 GENE.GHVT01087246.1~~GHVT01087246.1.p1  ORF type:complete len:132 (+),score=30.41 GHVT01087246.1:1565-1960(+)
MAEERRRASRGGDKKNGNDLPSGEPAQVNGECKKNKFAFDASYKQESNANGKAAASMAGGNSFPGWPVVVAVGLSLVAALLVGCTAAVAATAKLSQVKSRPAQDAIHHLRNAESDTCRFTNFFSPSNADTR